MRNKALIRPYEREQLWLITRYEGLICHGGTFHGGMLTSRYGYGSKNKFALKDLVLYLCFIFPRCQTRTIPQEDIDFGCFWHPLAPMHLKDYAQVKMGEPCFPK